MRKIYLITLIISAGMTASAQVKKSTLPLITNERAPKPDLDLTNPVKPQYKKVVVIPLEDWQMISGALDAAKLAPLSDPQLTNDQKVQQYQAIGQYLRELPKRIKLDSVKVEGVKP